MNRNIFLSRYGKMFLLASALLYGSNDATAQCSTSSSPVNYCGYGDAIDAFSLAGVSSIGNSGCNNGTGYVSFTNPVRDLTIGDTYAYTASVGGGSYDQGLAIWIDLNNNGSYESSEMVANSNYNISHSGTLTIPSTATSANNVKMRVRCAYYTNISSTDACTDNIGYYGETEDYLVNLLPDCPPISISSQPLNADVCNGATVQFQVSSSTATAYKWQVNTGSGFTDIPAGGNYNGVGTNKLTVSTIPSNFDMNLYRCVAIDDCQEEAISNSAMLTITDSTKIDIQSVSGNYCDGVNTMLLVKAKGAPAIGYEWQVDRGIGFQPLPGSFPYVGHTNDTMYITPLADTMNGYVFRCVTTGVCNTDTSENINIVVDTYPEFVSDPVDTETKEGQSASFVASAAGNVSYRWQANSGKSNDWVNINNTSNYDGVLTNQLTVLNPALSQTGYRFRCVLNGLGNCSIAKDTTAPAVLTVYSTLGINDALGNTGSVVLYPNPSQDKEVMIKADSKLGNVLNVKVSDKLGRTVSVREVKLSGDHIGRLDVSQLIPGFYTISISDASNNSTETIKFIKQ